MTKKEIYFAVYLTLGLLAAFFVPILLVTHQVLSSEAFIVSVVILCFLCGTGSFSIPSVLLFIREKLKEKGKLTQPLRLTLNITSLALLALLAVFSFLTFLLPLIVDYPSSCCGGCPSDLICWAGIPMNSHLWYGLVASFTVLSGLSLPFFILMIAHWIEAFRNKKPVHQKKEAVV